MQETTPISDLGFPTNTTKRNLFNVDGDDVVKDYKALSPKDRVYAQYILPLHRSYRGGKLASLLLSIAPIIKENYHLIEDIYKQIEPLNREKS